jgi:hypothetical protein
MLQQVIQGGDYGIFTQTALVLFFGAFVVLLAITFFRPRSQTDRFARMPLADDNNTEPITTPPTTHGQGDEKL